MPESDTVPEFPAQECPDCGAIYGHPAVACRECGSEELNDHPLDGTGVVYAGTTIRVPGADHQGEEPFEVCLVDVGGDERVRVTARIEEPSGLGPGDRVEFVGKRDGAFYFRAA